MSTKLKNILASKKVKIKLDKSYQDWVSIATHIAMQLSAYNFTDEESKILNTCILEKPVYYTSVKSIRNYYKRLFNN
jgi:hypothetical protein